MRKKWIGVLLAPRGSRVEATTNRGLHAMAARRKTVVVDSWRAKDPPPFGSSDAREWDDYRTRHGYSGSHH